MRKIININDSWLFSKDNENFEKIDLPHTWNGIDGQDGGNDYYRGTCIYKKYVDASDIDCDEIWIEFEGVNSSSKIFFENEIIGEHHGGYSGFRFRLPKKLGLLIVEVDNSPNESVYPQQADFTFYGGIYRDVKLVGLNRIHFDYNFGDCFKVTPILKDNKAEITFESKISEAALVEYEILDGDNVVYRGINTKFVLDNPHLWNGTIDPYLYTANAYVLVDETVVDNLSTRFGIRSFEITADKGFFLNGKSYPLHGVSRHQDRPIIGNALKFEHHKEDIDLICEMGANTVRLAHYQHNQVFYDLCDEKGIIVWAEIPYISRHLNKGMGNTFTQMYELILQNYNHPSIVVWGLSNEITMGGANDNNLIDNHRKLNDICHELDKTRLTTLAALTMCPIDAKYLQIPDVIAYNHYFGWYGGNTDMNGDWFDNFHKKYPNRPIGFSEYGCEALNWHSSYPEQGDYTEEYQAYYHEELIKQISARPFIWATYVWNMFDFAADARAEGGEAGMNHKGLVTFDRRYKKDGFFAYKAWLSSDPVLHICSKRYVDRVDEITKVTVYSNQPMVELYLNGKLFEKQEKGEYPFFYFNVPNIGTTEIMAVSGDLKDIATIKKVDKINQEYIMQDEGAVINWFEIDTPTGYYSINDTVGDIMSNFNGIIVLLSMIPMLKRALFGNKSSDNKEKASVAGFSINKSMIEMAKGFALKRAFTMLGGKFTKEEILRINKRLNKIKKRK